jgi:hypothetical protein
VHACCWLAKRSAIRLLAAAASGPGFENLLGALGLFLQLEPYLMQCVLFCKHSPHQLAWEQTVGGFWFTVLPPWCCRLAIAQQFTLHVVKR